MSLLGLDVGTTGCKAVVVTADGEVVGRAYREYGLRTPRAGWAELDADEVWEALSWVSRTATHAVDEPVEALAVAAAGEVALPVADNGSALAPAIVSIDTRAGGQFALLVGDVGWQRLRDLGGFAPHPYHTIARWLWLRDSTPEIYRRARWLVGWMELVCLRLNLPPTVDHSIAVRSLAFDLGDEQWDDSLLEDVGLIPAKLPRVVPSGTLVGHAEGRGCAELGIPPGTMVVAGGLDQLCAAHGIGIGSDSSAMVSLGTTAVLAACTRNDDVSAMLPRVPWLLPGTSLVIGGSPAGGALLQWFRDQLGTDERLIA